MRGSDGGKESSPSERWQLWGHSFSVLHYNVCSCESSGGTDVSPVPLLLTFFFARTRGVSVIHVFGGEEKERLVVGRCWRVTEKFRPSYSLSLFSESFLVWRMIPNEKRKHNRHRKRETAGKIADVVRDVEGEKKERKRKSFKWTVERKRDTGCD